MTTKSTRTRPYSRHGLAAVKARVQLRGLDGIDKRTAAAQDLARFKEDLLTDLGGSENISTQELALVDLACRARLFLNHIDAWLMEQESLVNKKRRAVLPVLRERQQIAQHLAALLQQLGLQRRQKAVPSLQQYLETRTQPDNE